MPESSRSEYLEKFSAKKYAVLDAEDNTLTIMTIM